ncbi:unnamed protein product, partial [marine sediment metagenome]
MNNNQKIVLSIFIPIILFFITLMIANSVGIKVITHSDIYYDSTTKTFESEGWGSYKTYTHHPFDLEKTWYVWLLFLIFVCIFEYKLFG